MAKFKLTKEIYEKLKAELDFLKHKRRAEVARKLKSAVAQGDISENAEYDEAKDESAAVEGKIIELSQKLANAEIVEYTESTDGAVGLGSTVTLKRSDGQVVKYQIVLPDDMDLDHGKISAESPVAKALIGRRAGDKVEIEVPVGKVELEIAEVKGSLT